MFKLYEKVPKTIQCKHGSRLIDNGENPFLDGPCLLCISGQYNVDLHTSYANNSNFGVTKEGMKMARLRVRGQKNAGFSLEDFPVKFLSLLPDYKDRGKAPSTEEISDAFVSQYLLPLIANDGQKIECIQAMKNMRNVNIMCYCDGTKLVKNIEKKVITKMQELGYTDEECEKIQSQMCMFPIATNTLKGTQKSTCISFKDINDGEINGNVTPEERQGVLASPVGKIFAYSNNEIAYLFAGNGEHDLKNYTRVDTQVGMAMPACLSSVLSKALENSIYNSSSETFIPITVRTTYS